MSEDRGATWRVAMPPGKPASSFDCVATVYDPPAGDPNMAYATFGDSDRLWVTNDRGVRWAALPRTKQTFVSPTKLAVDPRDARHLAAMVMVPDLINGANDRPGLSEATTRHVELDVSDDGGRTWNRPAGATEAHAVFPDAATFAFDAEAPGVIYAGTRFDGVWATADDGVTWGPLAGQGADQSVTSFLPDAPIPTAAAATAVAPRVAAPWRLFAAVGRVRSGLARIDRHPRRPPVNGRPRAAARRTEHVATCSGGSTISGVRSSVTWLAGGLEVGHGRRIRLPAKAVGLPVVCVFHAKTAFADVGRASPAVRPVGRPYQASRRIRGAAKAGSTLTCVVRWRGRPTRTSYMWRVRGVVRSSRATLKLTAGDRGRRATCTATARNRYGASHTSVNSRLVH